jgi:hypothetical protein
MTSEQIAAWVAAGAACVQAVGAIAAIRVAVNLARASEARVIASEKASAAREEAARIASEARENAVREAAERRASDGRVAARDSLIAVVSGYLTDAIAAVTVQRQQQAQLAADNQRGIYMGDMPMPSLLDLANMVPDLQSKCNDADLSILLARLPRQLTGLKQIAVHSETPDRNLPRFDAVIAELVSIASDYETLRSNRVN